MAGADNDRRGDPRFDRRAKRNDSHDNDPQLSGGQDDQAVPTDLNAVAADEQFLNALIAGRPVRARTIADAELADLLADWRDDIVADPIPVAPSLRDVEAAMVADKRVRQRRRGMRVVKFVAAASAASIVALGGITALSHNASPGDPLWSVKEVMFGKEATKTLTSSEVSDDLDRAQQALDAGDTATALAYVTKAQQGLDRVSDETTRAALTARINELLAAIAAKTNSAVTVTKTVKPNTPAPAKPPTTTTPPTTWASTTPPTSTTPSTSETTTPSEPSTSDSPSVSLSSVPASGVVGPPRPHHGWWGAPPQTTTSSSTTYVPQGYQN